MDRLAKYIYDVVLAKGADIRKTQLDIGELIFDYNGDFVGIYLGNNTIQPCANEQDDGFWP